MKLHLHGEVPALLNFEQAGQQATRAEGIDSSVYANVDFCSSARIYELNSQQRGIERVTDVLSFPSLNLLSGQTAGTAPKQLLQEWDDQEQACFLGDIFICLDKAKEQAQEYGHSLERECAYLLVHGLFHLFGYDHANERDRAAMREKEEQVLKEIGLSRLDNEELLRGAREAMKSAYVPYSRFRVGACLLGKSGKIYLGCNVENASYGLTNCAERTAVFKAVSEGEQQFEAIAIAADTLTPWPCGACRQVLSEFSGDLRVLVTWGDGRVETSTLQALLPHSFSPAHGVQDVLGKEQVPND